MRAFLSAAAAVLLIAGCAGTNRSVDAPRIVALGGEAQAQDSTTLRVGQELQVRLRSQAGTGYSWQLASVSGDIVAYRNRTNERDADEQSTPGSTLWEVFNLHGVAAGQTVLKFDYRRPWEQNTAPARSAVLTVDVAR
jgi:predicted secreted protein